MTAQNTNKLFATLTSFIGMGIFIVLLILGLVFFSYLLIIGGIIGLILFVIAWVRAKFFMHKMKKHNHKKTSKMQQGRTIDHDSL